MIRALYSAWQRRRIKRGLARHGIYVNDLADLADPADVMREAFPPLPPGRSEKIMEYVAEQEKIREQAPEPDSGGWM